MVVGDWWWMRECCYWWLYLIIFIGEMATRALTLVFIVVVLIEKVTPQCRQLAPVLCSFKASIMTRRIHCDADTHHSGGRNTEQWIKSILLQQAIKWRRGRVRQCGAIKR